MGLALSPILPSEGNGDNAEKMVCSTGIVEKGVILEPPKLAKLAVRKMVQSLLYYIHTPCTATQPITPFGGNGLRSNTGVAEKMISKPNSLGNGDVGVG